MGFEESQESVQPDWVTLEHSLQILILAACALPARRALPWLGNRRLWLERGG